MRLLPAPHTTTNRCLAESPSNKRRRFHDNQTPPRPPPPPKSTDDSNPSIIDKMTKLNAGMIFPCCWFFHGAETSGIGLLTLGEGTLRLTVIPNSPRVLASQVEKGALQRPILCPPCHHVRTPLQGAPRSVQRTFLHPSIHQSINPPPPPPLTNPYRSAQSLFARTTRSSLPVARSRAVRARSFPSTV